MAALEDLEGTKWIVSFSPMVVAQLDLLRNRRETKAYKNDVYLLAKELNEEVGKINRNEKACKPSQRKGAQAARAPLQNGG